HCANGGFGIVARSFDFLLAAFELVNVHEHQNRTVHLVIERNIRTDAQVKPMPVPVTHFVFALANAGDDLLNDAIQIGHVEAVPDPAKRTPYIGGKQIELLFGLRAETPNGQIAAEQQDSQLGGRLEVDQVVGEAVEFGV